MITIYQVDKSKLVEIGSEGYQPKQKQAWICYDEIPTGDFNINIIDDNVLIEQIGKMVETKFTTNELLLSINNDTENIDMNIYYFNKSANKAQCIQIAYLNCPEESNFELSKKILDYIQEYAENHSSIKYLF